MKMIVASPWLVGGLVLVSSSAAVDAKDLKASAPLVRPDGAPDDDAKGKIELRHDPSSGDGRVDFDAQNLDGSLTFDVFVEDPPSSDTMVDVGAMEVDEDGDMRLRFDTDDGPLPFDVNDVGELSGRRVEVQNGSVVFLVGVVPEPSDGKGKGGWVRGAASMVRPGAPPDPDAKGAVEVRLKLDDNRARLSVKAEKLPDQAYSVFMEDDVDSGVFNDVGAMVTDAGEDGPRLKLDSNQGDPLPYGALSPEELEGRAVEVRGADTQTYLVGVVPPLVDTKSKKPAKKSSKLSGVVGKGGVEVLSHPAVPSEELEIEVKDQAPAATLDVFIEDPGSSVQTLVGQIVTNGSGKGKLAFRTKHGDALPFGRLFVADLAGLAVEVRDGGSNVLLTGAIPAVNVVD